MDWWLWSTQDQPSDVLWLRSHGGIRDPWWVAEGEYDDPTKSHRMVRKATSASVLHRRRASVAHVDGTLLRRAKGGMKWTG